VIYCPACQPHDANRGFIPVLCTACADTLAADRREQRNATRRSLRAVEARIDKERADLARRDAEREDAP
jgi:hypothetical protein